MPRSVNSATASHPFWWNRRKALVPASRNVEPGSKGGFGSWPAPHRRNNQTAMDAEQPAGDLRGSTSRCFEGLNRPACAGVSNRNRDECRSRQSCRTDSDGPDDGYRPAADARSEAEASRGVAKDGICSAADRWGFGILLNRPEGPTCGCPDRASMRPGPAQGSVQAMIGFGQSKVHLRNGKRTFRNDRYADLRGEARPGSRSFRRTARGSQRACACRRRSARAHGADAPRQSLR